MKINKPKSKKTPIIIVIVAIAIFVAAVAIYMRALDSNLFGWQKADSNKSINYSGPSDDQKAAGSQVKQASIENDQAKNGSSGSDPLPKPVPQENGKSTVGVSITTSTQLASAYQIRVLISTVTANGVCTLTLSKGSNTIQKTSAVSALASSATCQGFDIPLSELSSGTWEAVLVFENNSLMGTASSTITVQ